MKAIKLGEENREKGEVLDNFIRLVPPTTSPSTTKLFYAASLGFDGGRAVDLLQLVHQGCHDPRKPAHTNNQSINIYPSSQGCIQFLIPRTPLPPSPRKNQKIGKERGKGEKGKAYREEKVEGRIRGEKKKESKQDKIRLVLISQWEGGCHETNVNIKSINQYLCFNSNRLCLAKSKQN